MIKSIFKKLKEKARGISGLIDALIPLLPRSLGRALRKVSRTLRRTDRKVRRAGKALEDLNDS